MSGGLDFTLLGVGQETPNSEDTLSDPLLQDELDRQGIHYSVEIKEAA